MLAYAVSVLKYTARQQWQTRELVLVEQQQQ